MRIPTSFSFQADTKTQLDWLAKNESRDKTAILRRLIAEEYQKQQEVRSNEPTRRSRGSG